MGTYRPKLFRLNARVLGRGLAPERDRPDHRGNTAESAFEFAKSARERCAAGATLARRFMGSLHDFLVAHWDHEPRKAPASRTHSKRFAIFRRTSLVRQRLECGELAPAF